jgi:hypothetical protein
MKNKESKFENAGAVLSRHGREREREPSGFDMYITPGSLREAMPK